MGSSTPIVHETPVLVVGSGPVGLITSLQLARFGQKCMLVERNYETTKWPKMDITNCRSMELLRNLGLADALRRIDVMVIVCSTLAVYNAFELLTLIFMTFKRRKGLYFWSIFFASFGIIPYCVGWLIVYFDLTHDWVGMIIDSIGWILLVSGQSVVLYSRLHLVLNDPKILRAVLWMVIANGVVWHTSIAVLLFGSSYFYVHPS